MGRSRHGGTISIWRRGRGRRREVETRVPTCRQSERRHHPPSRRMMDPAERAEANMLRSVRVWAAASGGRVRESDSLLCVTCPAALRSFNQVFVKNGAVKSGELAEVVETYRRENPRFRVRM